MPVIDFELSCGHDGREFKNYFGGGRGGGGEVEGDGEYGTVQYTK